jgi:hypothetical protein
MDLERIPKSAISEAVSSITLAEKTGREPPLFCSGGLPAQGMAATGAEQALELTHLNTSTGLGR